MLLEGLESYCYRATAKIDGQRDVLDVIVCIQIRIAAYQFEAFRLFDTLSEAKQLSIEITNTPGGWEGNLGEMITSQC